MTWAPAAGTPTPSRPSWLLTPANLLFLFFVPWLWTFQACAAPPDPLAWVCHEGPMPVLHLQSNHTLIEPVSRIVYSADVRACLSSQPKARDHLPSKDLPVVNLKELLLAVRENLNTCAVAASSSTRCCADADDPAPMLFHLVQFVVDALNF
jgi:hypothetical protein